MSNVNGAKWIRPERRLAIYDRDGFACVYCGRTSDDGAALSLDHVEPREMGGSNANDNLVTACVPCNSAKRDASNRRFFEILRDKGIDTATLSRRIRAACARKVNIDTGKRHLAARKGA